LLPNGKINLRRTNLVKLDPLSGAHAEHHLDANTTTPKMLLRSKSYTVWTEIKR
jgi:hypothetical protein